MSSIIRKTLVTGLLLTNASLFAEEDNLAGVGNEENVVAEQTKMEPTKTSISMEPSAQGVPEQELPTRLPGSAEELTLPLEAQPALPMPEIPAKEAAEQEVSVPFQAMEIPVAEPFTLPAAPVEIPTIETAQPPVQGESVDQLLQSEEAYPEGIDTLSVTDSGNWYLKRAIWKQARPVNGQIRSSIRQINDLVAQLLEKRKKLEPEIRNFYLSFGVEQFRIGEIIDQIIARLKEEAAQEPKGITPAQLKALVEISMRRQAVLQDLKALFDKVRQTDENIASTILTTIVEQQRRALSYEEKALEDYYRISEILDDREAQRLLYEMQNYAENINAIYLWIKTDVQRYISRLTAKLNDLMNNIQKIVAQLADEGIILREQTDKQVEELQKDEQKKTKQEQKNKTTGFLSWIFNFFNNILTWLKSLFRLGFRS